MCANDLGKRRSGALTFDRPPSILCVVCGLVGVWWGCSSLGKPLARTVCVSAARVLLLPPPLLPLFSNSPSTLLPKKRRSSAKRWLPRPSLLFPDPLYRVRKDYLFSIPLSLGRGSEFVVVVCSLFFAQKQADPSVSLFVPSGSDNRMSV